MCLISKIDPTIIVGMIGLFGLIFQLQHNSKTMKAQSAREFVAKSRADWLHETRELYAQYSLHFSNMYFCVVNGAFEEEYYKLRNDYFYTNDLLKMLFNPISDIDIINMIDSIQNELTKTQVLIISNLTSRVADPQKKEHMDRVVVIKNDLDKLVSLYLKKEWEQIKKDIDYIK